MFLLAVTAGRATAVTVATIPVSAPSATSAFEGQARQLVARSAPAFRRFPAPRMFRARHAQPRLATKRARLFRTRLRRAAKGRPNYDAIHALTLWGCGSQCLDGAVVNLVTDKVVFLPDGVSLCFDARLNSRLLMLANGGFGGLAQTYAFYDFNGRRFRLVKLIKLPEDSAAANKLCRYGAPAVPSAYGY
jgi:hypothetical protein